MLEKMNTEERCAKQNQSEQTCIYVCICMGGKDEEGRTREKYELDRQTNRHEQTDGDGDTDRQTDRQTDAGSIQVHKSTCYSGVCVCVCVCVQV